MIEHTSRKTGGERINCHIPVRQSEDIIDFGNDSERSLCDLWYGSGFDCVGHSIVYDVNMSKWCY